jgi:hypothetical protein
MKILVALVVFAIVAVVMIAGEKMFPRHGGLGRREVKVLVILLMLLAATALIMLR